MQIVKLSGKPVNVEGLELKEKAFIELFETHKPWRDMLPKDRLAALKRDYKTYLKHKPKDKEEGSE